MEIHPSCHVTPFGQVFSSLGNVRWCFQSCSSSRRRVQHHQVEEQRMSGQGDCSLTLSCESPMPEPPSQDLTKVLLPGFREIAQSLTRDQPSPVIIEAPQELRPPNLLVGSAVVMLTATQISKDKAAGITYMDTVTTPVGWVSLETTHMAFDPGGPTLEDITDVTRLWMADDHPK